MLGVDEGVKHHPEFSSSFRGRHCGIIKTDPTDLQKFDNDIKTKYRTPILGEKMDKNLNNTAKLLAAALPYIKMYLRKIHCC